MARTMTDEQERQIRLFCEVANPRYQGVTLLAELDAERAAHEATKAEQVRVMQRMGNRTGGSLAFGRIRVLEEELAALKARLALAEAVCESCSEDWDDEFGGFDVYDHDALAAWRAAK